MAHSSRRTQFIGKLFIFKQFTGKQGAGTQFTVA